MTMHPDDQTPWARPHARPEAFAWAIDEATPRPRAVWSTLARTVAAYALMWVGLTYLALAFGAAVYALIAHGIMPLAAFVAGR